uniref:G-protein coupled receptors family 3 profile domain-containing protein n=1 Tax=Anabas testudineus TaxID=64144 RepID=A0A3Q1J0N0_ANATE
MSRLSWISTFWISSVLSLLFMGLVGGQLGLKMGLQAVQAISCSRWSTPSDQGLFQDGDIIIGGLFNIYYNPPTIDHDFTQLPRYNACTGLQNLPLQYVYTMVFALEEINHSATLLPGVKLGYRIHDSCAIALWGVQAALSLVGGNSTSCDSTALLNSSILAKILAPLSVPLVSYTASCSCLSNRLEYPNFFRTMPSDFYQARAFAQLAIRYKWNWIGTVAINTNYGLSAIKEETQGAGVCLSFTEILNRENIVSDSRRAALTIQASTAKVILIFAWYTDVWELFLQLGNINVTGRQFLASEAWSTSGDILQDPVTRKVASGVLGIAIRSSTIPGFENYLRSLKPSNRPDDMFLRKLWENVFGCRPVVTPFSTYTALPPCNGTESLEGIQHPFTYTSQLRVTYNVYLAVYAAAHALHSLLCPIRDSPLGENSSTCFFPKDIKPIELLQQLNQVNVTTPQGESFSFHGADITPKYDLVNWQNTPEGKLKLVLIGRVDGFDIHLNESAIQWSTGSNQVPVSVCSEGCAPGTRMANRKGEPVCCFDCIPCAEGEISNKTGSPQCDRCPLEFWSNAEKTACVPRQLDFLSYNETLGITLTTVAVSGVAVTTAVFVVFIYYPSCFFFQQAAFGISFVLCVSCLKVKTIVVLAAFRSARPGAEALMKWFGPGQQRGSVCIFTCIQVVICFIWLSLSPPVPQPDLQIPGLKVTLKCAMVSVVGFSLVLGYIGLLACTSLLLAFLARKLPDNFNEAKLITFSMLIFCAVWVAFVPAYVSSPGKYAVAVEIFAILASSYGLLFCIFAPKCFIILLRPEKNTKKHLMAR